MSYLILSTLLDGWWKGELNGFEGVFPENHVEIIDVCRFLLSTLLTLSGTTYRSGSTVSGQGFVCLQSTSRGMTSPWLLTDLQDQLDLEEGDIITVVQELEHGWWAGTINGKAGIFPASFTEKIADSRAGANPFAADTSSTLFGSSMFLLVPNINQLQVQAKMQEN